MHILHIFLNPFIANLIVVAFILFIGFFLLFGKDRTWKRDCVDAFCLLKEQINNCPTLTSLAYLEGQVNDYYNEYSGFIDDTDLKSFVADLNDAIIERRDQLRYPIAGNASGQC